MKKIAEVLEQLSLPESEITLYLLLLRHPGLGIADIVKQSLLHRPRVTQLLTSLEERQFVTNKRIGRRTKYYAASPHVLVEKAKDVLANVRHVLPELIRTQNASKQVEHLRVLYGEQGLAACFLDVVVSSKKGDLFYQINSTKDQPFVDSVVPAEYRPLRDSKDLERKAITTRYVGSFKKPRLERTIRYIEDADEVFEHDVIQFIYNDKVALLDFNTLTGTIIQNQAIADFQKSIFLTLYKRLKE